MQFDFELNSNIILLSLQLLHPPVIKFRIFRILFRDPSKGISHVTALKILNYFPERDKYFQMSIIQHQREIIFEVGSGPSDQAKSIDRLPK